MPFFWRVEYLHDLRGVCLRDCNAVSPYYFGLPSPQFVSPRDGRAVSSYGFPSFRTTRECHRHHDHRMSDLRRRRERGASTRHETRRSARYGARFRISSSAREQDLSCPTRSPNSARPFTPCRHDSLTPIHGAPAPSGEAGRGAHPTGRAVAPTRESGARSRPGQRPSDEIRAPSLPPPTDPEIIRALHLTSEQKANIPCGYPVDETGEGRAMAGLVRELARDAVSFGALVSFLAMVALWGDFVGKVGLF